MHLQFFYSLGGKISQSVCKHGMLNAPAGIIIITSPCIIDMDYSTDGAIQLVKSPASTLTHNSRNRVESSVRRLLERLGPRGRQSRGGRQKEALLLSF